MLWFASPLHAQQRFDPPEPAAGSIEKGATLLPAADAPAATNIPAAAAPPSKPLSAALRELSPWSMFLSADALVKAVIISLAFASLVTWTIFLAKLVNLKFAQWRLGKSLVRLSAARTLSEAQLALGPKRGIIASLLAAATLEIRMSTGSATDAGIKERTASRFAEIVRAEARMVRQGMVTIATIGSTAPFVGLFGTVWGIMNSFIGISKSQTSNLAVVAPGIAEALLATACGLAAAIPAVMIYNQLTRTMKGYLELVGRASGGVARLLSRDLDRAQGQINARAAE